MRRRLAVVVLAGFTFFLLGMAPQAQAQWRDRNAQWNSRNNNYQQTYDRGYRDGMKRGRADRNRGAYNDRAGGNWGGWGNSNSSAYRDGYRAGYSAGYGSGNGRWGRNAPYGNPNNYPNNPNNYPNNYPNSNYPNYPNSYPNGPYGNGRSGYPGSSGYGNPSALGYQTGLQKGQSDAAQRKSFNPNRHDAYKDADQGYSVSGYGSKSQYQSQYRQGFLQGYRAGYGRGY